MPESLAALLFVASLALALVVVHRPLGDLLYWLRPPSTRTSITATPTEPDRLFRLQIRMGLKMPGSE
jgi:hypothetical protein